jgi:predicted metal-dependent HD superfamily phosphohydrolase
MRMKRRWQAFCRRASDAAGQGGPPTGLAGANAADAKEVFAELDRRYREPGRHYHTWRHVAACLRELRRARPSADDEQAMEALELAVWFHDAVYEPGRADNEEASAELALHWSAALGLGPGLGRKAARLILATRHDRSGTASWDPGEALLRDIDLAVLGAGWLRFMRYERGIAREYAGLPPESFRKGRAGLLRDLLSRSALYATPGFRRRLERRARRNLALALARLERRRPTGRAAARRSTRPADRPGRR